MRSFVVAAGSMVSIPGDKDKNITAMTRLIEQAAERKVDLLLLPECCLTGPFTPALGHTTEDTHKASESVPGPSTEKIVDLAAKYNMYISFGTAETGMIKVPFITQVIVGPKGYIGKNRKRYVGATEHKMYRSGGDDFDIFDLGFAKVAHVICWEGIIPEIAQVLVKNGADLLLAPHACGVKDTQIEAEKIDSWPKVADYCKSVRSKYLAKMARRNNVPVVFVNQASDTTVSLQETVPVCSGKAMIFSQTGQVLAENQGLKESLLVYSF